MAPKEKKTKARLSGKEVASRLALLAFGIVVAVTLAEVVFRLHLRREGQEQMSDDSWRQRITKMNRTIYKRSDDPDLIYEPNPGASVEMPYGIAGFNSAGMRDDHEHPLERPEGKVRVALLGDSLAWSENLPLHDSLGRALKKQLGPDRFEVLTFGVTGYDTAQEARWYERAVRKFQPQELVLLYCLNDIMIMSGPFNAFATDEEAERKREQERLIDRLAPVRAENIEHISRQAEQEATLKALARILSLYRLRAFDTSEAYTDEYLTMYGHGPAQKRVASSLEKLGAMLREDGVRGHLVISPLLRSWQSYHWAGAHDQVSRWAKEAGFEVVDPLPQWKGTTSPEELRLPGDSLHYGRRGNKALAKVMAAAVDREAFVRTIPAP